MDYLPLVFDGVLILVFVICIFVGRSNGFMKSVLSFLSIIISFAVAQSFSAPVAAWANESFAYSAVNAYVETYIEDAFRNDGVDPESENIVRENIPDEVVELAEEYGVSLSEIADDASQGFEQVSKEIAEKVLDAVLLPILEAIAFLLIYVVCVLILKIVVSFICKLKLPVISRVDKTLGGVVGALKGIGIVAIISVFAVVVSRLASGDEITDAIEQTLFIKTIGEAVIQFVQGG